MSPVLIAVLALVAGLLLLAMGADRFVDSAASLASRFHLSPVVVGAIVVGFGTSAPEMLVSAIAAAQGSAGLAIGNAVGSNIANVGLVLGASAIIAPLVVDAQTRRCELPAMLVVVLAVWALLAGGTLGRSQGAFVCLLLVVTLSFITWSTLRWRSASLASTGRSEVTSTPDTDQAAPGTALVASLLFGLVLLVGGSWLLVFGATGIAREFGVSEVVIGLTIVAVGTSLPELAAAIASVLRRELGLALGNVVGSNIFNLLAVLAMPALISPGAVPASILSRDYPIMVGLCLFVGLLAWRRDARLGRVAGALMLVAFATFQYITFHAGA